MDDVLSKKKEKADLCQQSTTDLGWGDLGNVGRYRNTIHDHCQNLCQN